MIVFITKYALTKGIFPEEVEICKYENDYGLVQSKKTQAFYHKGQYHESMDDAISKAKEMRENKIKSLEMQLRKLNKLSFSIENTVK